MDAEDGPGHVLTVVNICRFWEENLWKKRLDKESKIVTFLYLWKTNLFECCQEVVDIIRVFEVKST